MNVFDPFATQYHHSFTAVDPTLGPLVLSVCLEEEENRLRVILRWRSLTILAYCEIFFILSCDTAKNVLLLKCPLSSKMSFSQGYWVNFQIHMRKEECLSDLNLM